MVDWNLTWGMTSSSDVGGAALRPSIAGVMLAHYYTTGAAPCQQTGIEV